MQVNVYILGLKESNSIYKTITEMNERLNTWFKRITQAHRSPLFLPI